MTFIPTPNCARFSIVQSFVGVPIINTIWVLKTSQFTSTDLFDTCALLEEWWKAHVLVYQSSNLTLTEINGLAQDSDTAPSFSLPVSTANTGGDSTHPTLAAQVAACLTFYTVNRGRTARGRIYFGAGTSNWLADPHTITSAMVNDFQIAGTELASDLAAAGLTHVVVSHVHNKTPRSSGLAQQVTSYVCHNRLDTMRRRVGRQSS